MGMVLFVVFAVMEAVLAVLTCTVFRDKLSWYRNQIILDGAGLAVMLGVMLAAAPEERWKWIGCLLVFAMGFACNCWDFLIGKLKAETGRKPNRNTNRAGVICLCAMSTVLVFGSLIPSYSFMQIDGLEEAIVTEMEDIQNDMVQEMRW